LIQCRFAAQLTTVGAVNARNPAITPIKNTKTRTRVEFMAGSLLSFAERT
jgi:hypothetical protein